VARSTEFPQFAWVPLTRVVDSDTTRWTAGRKAGQPTVIFIHTTEGSEGRTSAENGAAYDQRRTDGTSTHFFVDQDSAVQCVKTTDEAHAARAHGNDVGIQIEVCGRAGQTAAQWKDPASAGAVEQAAQVSVAIRRKYGKARFPLRNLTPAQLRAGLTGFAEHRDATLAWPSDGGTHTDPGPNFPWSTLFARIATIEGNGLMATQFSGSTAANDVAQLDASAASITTQAAWSTGGGQHSKAGDGVWNTGIPRKPGAADATTNPRDYAWTLVRDILIASQSAVVKIDQLATAVATLQADNTLMKQQLAQLTADAADSPNVIVDDVRYAIANP
jgi:N-acetyl-anhydromuramyl-L-alanine amidase AmpD